MAGVAVISLLEKLSRFRTHHAHLISDVDKELELLQIDLSVLKEFLLEHDGELEEDKDWEWIRVIGQVETEVNKEIKEFMREVKGQIKECVYEVEDTIDASLTQIIEKNLSAGFLFSKGKMKTLLMRIGELKEVIVNKFPASSKVKPLLKTGNTEGISGARAPMTTMDNVVVGRHEEETIISRLMESREELDVISLKGWSGLGKTTLARRVYVNTKIAYEFPVRIWISVSPDFKLDDILRNILRVFTSQDIDCLSHKELSENVVACLEKKKFLLVLDDMHDLDLLRAVQNVLSNSDGMGKVLITTRISVGKHADFNMRLKSLDPMDSWKLLQLKVFGDLKRCPPELEGIGQTVARKCRGLPINIILVGGILMGQSMKSNIPIPMKDVLEVYENVNKDLVEVTYDDPYNVHVMGLAFNRLSDELRQCLLYMGVFPENYEISAWTLTHLWIAEGFVRPMEGHNLEEAATQNLDHLIRRGLVMVDKINPFGKVKTCRVHSMIYDLVTHEGPKLGVFKPPRSLMRSYENIWRRVCVHSYSDINNFDYMHRKEYSSTVRSVLCFSESPIDANQCYRSSMLINSFPLLKVLDYKSIKFHRLPEYFTLPLHLRYVTLCIDILNTLPESFSELWNLETLVVDTKSRVITMEANIWRLIWLRHLKTNAAIVLSSNNEDQSLAGGENLQTLTRLSPESCTTEVSERARNLKSLGIRGDLEILFGKEFLERLNNLEKLKLIHAVIPKISSENPLHQLPPPNRFPPNLKWLTLSQTDLLWDHDMPTLANIKTLEVLKLKDDAFTGVIWRESGDCFPCLKFFLIETTDLVIWKASTKLLPRLSCLVLKNCENLREIPEAVAKNLERLEIEHLGKSAVDSARRIADRKQQAQEKEKSDCPFKLYIGPGCY